MEIDITDFVMNEAPMDYSASIAEIGRGAGKITWSAALERASEAPRLIADNPDALDAWRDDVREFGAWDDEEIDAWSAEECEALFIQFIAGDMREMDFDPDWSDDDWSAYQKEAEAGQLSGRIYRGDDGRVYFYIGS